MKRLAIILATVCAGMLWAAVAAHASFGLTEPEVTFTDAEGNRIIEAGSHPYAFNTSFMINTRPAPEGGGVLPDEEAKELRIDFPPGLVGTPTPVPRCADSDFLRVDAAHIYSYCPSSSILGRAEVAVGTGPVASADSAFEEPVPVYNLTPAPGVASKIGFIVKTAPVTVETEVNPEPPYNLVTRSTNIPNFYQFYGARVTLWGVPAHPSHDAERGGAVNLPQIPFLTLPTSCQGPLRSSFEAASWTNPSSWMAPLTATTDDGGEPPKPLNVVGCEQLRFSPTIEAKPTAKAASSPTGLDFALRVKDEGLTSATGRAQSQIRKSVVTLPEGFTVNPSIADGLEVCTEAQLARETAFSDPGAGCPDASKIGSVEVETPLLDESVDGSLYQAAPYENPFGSLIALYIVIKNPKLGIVVKQPLKVESDPVTGQLTTTAEEMPQLPFSDFRLHFREGTRSPLATPPTCGRHEVKAVMYPWAGGPPVTSTSAFEVITGPNAGPCPSGGLPPFKPGLLAGTLNNAAGSFSPFNLRLSRTDAEQEFTRFSIKLPPGITGKLAGIPYCPDAAIAAAKARTGPHGGQEELDNPSCPAASEIGRTLAGSGVGPSLAYAPGKIYLAGPYNGSNLSMVAITAGRVGPFDLGTVVIRQAFKIDPETAEVFIDSVGSDPVPHIIKGIPVHLRDIRAYVDKPDFVLNPTDCTRTSTASTLLGSGLDFGSAVDDRPVTVATPFQAADCAALPFKPKLKLRLKGGTRRGQNPAFTARLRMNGFGEAGIGKAQVTLPRSAFLDQAHIRTICTRVQFKAGAGNGSSCPPGSIYGKARAVTPILGEPLVGPVILRASDNPLPDLVAALRNSQVDFNLVGRIDSVNGRIRNTFETPPDAPVSSFVLEMRGGRKGLIENSANLCKGTHKALADFTGQNGKRHVFKPLLKAQCKKPRKGKQGKANGKRGRR